MGQKISEMTSVGAGALGTDEVELSRSSSSSSFRLALSALATYVRGLAATLAATTIAATGNITITAGSGNPSVSVAAATAGNNPSYRLMNTADGASTAWDMTAVYTDTPDDVQWQYGGVTKLTLSSSGLLTTVGTILVPSTAAYTFAQAPASGYGFTVVDNGSGSAPNVKIGANGTSGLNLLLFVNGNGTVGSIAVSGSATAFNTSSDRDLKIDRGVATTVDTLRASIVHDFDWKVDGRPDRGVFAQEAYEVKPSAVSVGDDTFDEDGRKVNPWAVDYSKFVPDLIVGWQNHDSRMTRIEQALGFSA